MREVNIYLQEKQSPRRLYCASVGLQGGMMGQKFGVQAIRSASSTMS